MKHLDTEVLDYLIIYTNHTEGQLKSFIGQIEMCHKMFIADFRDIIICCKP